MSDNLTDEESQALNRDIGQLEGLIDELLTYARLDRPQTDLHLSQVDLPDWLRSHIADVRLIHPHRHIELECPAAGVFGQIDLRLMERVIDNLINNALRYSRQKLRVSLWLDAQSAVLQVEDDGPAIPEQERERVFQPFVRLDPSRDRATGGCGLGLAIVHSVAVAMGGAVSVDSGALGGARFRFSWPVTLSGAPSLPAA